MNALEFFLSPCRCQQCADRVWALRDWSQFFRFYTTLSQITGSYTQAMQINDPDVIEQIASMRPDAEDWKPQPPRWWRFTDEIHALTNIADQLIASRAHGDDVKFYPRPVNPAAKERKRRQLAAQDDVIERARLANLARRGLSRDTIKY